MLTAMMTTIATLCTGVAASSKPNVMLIVADDQGFANIGYHNDTVLTPRIDELARAGEAGRIKVLWLVRARKAEDEDGLGGGGVIW